MQPHRAIYDKLLKVVPDLPKHLSRGIYYGCSKLNSPGMMDLHFDYVGKDKNGNPIIALSHYFEQNGDMVPDPDMQIRIVLEAKMAEAMTFQDQLLYREVYEERKGQTYVHLRHQKELNEFLDHWLTNIINQGHRIDLSKEKEEPELPEETDRTDEIKELRDGKADESKDRGAGR